VKRKLRKLDVASVPTRLIKLLKNWNTLNAALMDLTEREVAQLLSHEQENDNRITFILRLHARMNKLRSERERRALARSAGKNVVLP
jgi:hypothetical protein